jgi:hypothetical protein
MAAMTASVEARSEKPALINRTQAAAGAAFEVGAVVPVQFYDLIRRSAFLDGETRLVFAVLEDAIRTYLRQRESCRRRDRIEFAEVAQWFESGGGSSPFSFDYVCDVLELEPESFRRQLRILPHQALPTKQMRSVGRRQRVQTTRYARKRSAWET